MIYQFKVVRCGAWLMLCLALSPTHLAAQAIENDDGAPPAAVYCCDGETCYESDAIESCPAVDPVAKKSPAPNDRTYDPPLPDHGGVAVIDSQSQSWKARVEHLVAVVDECTPLQIPGTFYIGGHCSGRQLDVLTLQPVMSISIYVVGVRDHLGDALTEPQPGVAYEFWLHPNDVEGVPLALDGAFLSVLPEGVTK